jgi:hypothetical protein
MTDAQARAKILEMRKIAHDLFTHFLCDEQRYACIMSIQNRCAEIEDKCDKLLKLMDEEIKQ